MGVPGLWEILNKAGESRSLTHLAVVDGFEINASGKRAYRIGIDASIWYSHAAHSCKEGENPELRLLFFRLRHLAKLPILPLFVFDGRERPKEKRGSRMGKSGSHGLTAGLKTLLDAFGMEWREARGEAEAELAFLNRVGIIDAVLSDDVDCFLFGGVTIIKNRSLGLTGNKNNPALNADGKPSEHHVMIYKADTIHNHPDVGLTRGGLILFALLSGGDYDPHGVTNFGQKTAYGLARCNFGDQLLDIFRLRNGNVAPLLAAWRARVNDEIRTNSQGYLPSRSATLSVPASFPDMKILAYYMAPVTGEGGVDGTLRDTADPSLPRLAAFCEEKFGEWGHKSMIIHRFRTLLWEAGVMRVLRRAAMEKDKRERDGGRGGSEGTPVCLVRRTLGGKGADSQADRIASAFVNRPVPVVNDVPAGGDEDEHPLIMSITMKRTHVSTDQMLEYRVVIDPTQLVALAESGVKGKRRDLGPKTYATAKGKEKAGAQHMLDEEFAEFAELFAEAEQFHATSSGKGKGKEKDDPYAPMKVWIPASIMRRVHPDLVAEFETGGAKGKGKGRAVASDEEPPQSSQAKGAKGKGRAAPHDEEQPASQTSQQGKAKRANRKRKTEQLPEIPGDEPVTKRKRTSKKAAAADMPEPEIGRIDDNRFIFTFPYTDDPAGLVDFEHTIPVEQASGSSSVPRASAKRSSKVQPPSSSAPRKRPLPPVSEDEDDLDDARPRDRFDDLVDNIMGISGRAKAKGKARAAAPPGKRRVSARDARRATQADSDDESDRSVGESSSHRKTQPRAQQKQAPAPRRKRSRATDTPVAIRAGSEADSDEDSNMGKSKGAQRKDREITAAPFPALDPLDSDDDVPCYPRTAKVRSSKAAEDIIELSDSDGDGFRVHPGASSSQDSSLALGEGDFIDLT